MLRFPKAFQAIVALTVCVGASTLAVRPAHADGPSLKDSSYVSLCIGGAVTGAVVAARWTGVGVISGVAELPLIGIAAAASGAAGCAFAVAMRGLFSDCVGGPGEVDSKTLFNCTVRTVDAFLVPETPPATAVAAAPTAKSPSPVPADSLLGSQVAEVSEPRS